MKILLLLAILTNYAFTKYVCSNLTIKSSEHAKEVDFLFAVDASGTMQTKLDGIVAGIENFVETLNQTTISYRLALVVFGGKPALRLPFTSDTSAFISAIKDVTANDGSGNEASLEVLRLVLPPHNGIDLVPKCPPSVSDCKLSWRPTALKAITVATDEDSDLPTHDHMRIIGQENDTMCQDNYLAEGACKKPQRNWEPKFFPSIFKQVPTSDVFTYFRNESTMYLATTFEQEIVDTARSILDSGAFVNILLSTRVGTDETSSILPVSAFNERSSYWNELKQLNATEGKDDITVATYQFGHPGYAAQSSNFSEFNETATLEALKSNGFNNSLQARVLGAGAKLRVYDIDAFAFGEQDVASDFLSQLVNDAFTIVENCDFEEDFAATRTSTQTQSPQTDFTISWSHSTQSPTQTSTVDELDPTDAPDEYNDGDDDAPNDSDDGETPKTIGGVVGGVAGLGAIVASLVFYRSRVASRDALIHSNSESSLNGIHENPLYRSTLSRENPLYQSRSSLASDFSV